MGDDAIVVTATGVVTPRADSAEALAGAIEGPRPTWTEVEGGLPVLPLEPFDPKRYLDRRGLKDLSRLSQMTCAAAAALVGRLQGVEAGEVGVALGTAWGSVGSVLALDEEARRLGTRFVNPLLFAESVANVPAGQVAIVFGWSAFNVTVSCGGASGLEAVRQAAGLVLEGRGAAAVAGGADELNLPLVRCLHAESPAQGEEATATRPPQERFYSEGACLLLLERTEAARRRGATALAAIEGSCAGLAPVEDGASERDLEEAIEAVLRRLLREAGRRPEEVDLVVSAAGTGRGDRAERAAVRRVFAGRPRVLEPKTLLGEAWGASGPSGAVAAIEALRRRACGRAAVLSRCFRGPLTALLLARGAADAS